MQNHTFSPGNNRSVTATPEATFYTLYKTAVVTRYADGRIKLDSGGHQTSTTQRAMTQVSKQYGYPFKVYAKKGTWFVHWPKYSTDAKHDREFFDGIILDNIPREI